MKKRWVAAAVAVTASIGLILSGCSSTGSSNDSAGKAGGAGKTIKVGFAQ